MENENKNGIAITSEQVQSLEFAFAQEKPTLQTEWTKESKILKISALELYASKLFQDALEARYSWAEKRNNATAEKAADILIKRGFKAELVRQTLDLEPIKVEVKSRKEVIADEIERQLRAMAPKTPAAPTPDELQILNTAQESMEALKNLTATQAVKNAEQLKNGAAK